LLHRQRREGQPPRGRDRPQAARRGREHRVRRAHVAQSAHQPASCAARS
jgi:hypothetical protein